MISHIPRTGSFSLIAAVLLLWDASYVNAWLPTTPQRPTAILSQSQQQQQRQKQQALLVSSPSSSALYSSAASSSISTASQEADDDDDEEEYEYVEYDLLTEREYVGSEWLVGTCMDSSPNKIAETWCRLAVDKDGKNVAIWGDNSEGKWSMDVASQFLSISKETFWGKEIWAGVVDDYYYLQGTVRGWSFLTAAEVIGQWQARRLGVDPDEAPTAPWFEKTEEVEQGDESSDETTDDTE